MRGRETSVLGLSRQGGAALGEDQGSRRKIIKSSSAGKGVLRHGGGGGGKFLREEEGVEKGGGGWGKFCGGKLEKAIPTIKEEVV